MNRISPFDRSRNTLKVPLMISRRIPRIIKARLRPSSCDLKAIYGIGDPTPRGHLKILNGPRYALLSYVTMPFRMPLDHPLNLHFSNVGIARNTVRALNELGYIADVVEWTDVNFLPQREYDLFIGHGGWNYEHIARMLPHATKIYLSTGMYWKEHNMREAQRFLSLQQRRGVGLPYDRWISRDEEYANQIADGIISLGGEAARESYSGFPLVVNMNVAAYHDDRYDHTTKDFAGGRNKFLFFSGPGNVHKGLDLLLETFSIVSAHLYVCQEIRRDFSAIYRHELEDYSNIHVLGTVPLRSQQFYELTDLCDFAIHPSCAEGQPGSVVECMHQGLIPVVSRETNIDTDEFGITLMDCSIEEIGKVVNNLSQRSPEWCEAMSRRTRKAALAEFSEDAFLRNMKAAIERIISERAGVANVPAFWVDSFSEVGGTSRSTDVSAFEKSHQHIV